MLSLEKVECLLNTFGASECTSNYIRLTASVAEIAQLGERQTEDLKVPGSNPESS